MSFLDTISPFVPVVGNFVSGLFNNSATEKANKTNIILNRESRSWQEKMLQQQNSYNLSMWNLSNAYNSPSAQLERFKVAGVNPYFALGNVSGQGSVVSSASVPSTQTPTVQAKNYDYISSAANSALASKALAEDVHAKQIANSYTPQLNQLSLAKMLQEISGLSQDSRQKKYVADLTFETLSYVAKQTKQQTQLNDLKIASEKLNLTYQNLTNADLRFKVDFLNPVQLDGLNTSIKKAIAEIAVLKEQGKLTAAQTKKTIAETAKVIVDTQLAPIYASAAATSANASMIGANASTVTAGAALINANANSANAATNRMNAFTNQFNANTNRLNFKLSKSQYLNVKDLIRTKMQSEINHLDMSTSTGYLNTLFNGLNTINNIQPF